VQNREGRSFFGSSGQLGGKLLTGERGGALIDPELSGPITESGHKLKRICFVFEDSREAWPQLFIFLVSFTSCIYTPPPTRHTHTYEISASFSIIT